MSVLAAVLWSSSKKSGLKDAEGFSELDGFGTGTSMVSPTNSKL